MVNPLNYSGKVSSLSHGDGQVTLVEGTTFCISMNQGDIVSHGSYGLFFRDTRIISHFELIINGSPTESLGIDTPDPYRATFVSRGEPPAGKADSSIVVFRERYIGRGLREDITVENFGSEATYCHIEIFVESDFANLFAVKEGRVKVNSNDDVLTKVDTNELFYMNQKSSLKRGVKIATSQKAKVVNGLLSFEVVIASKSKWSVCISVSPNIDGKDISPRYPCGVPVEKGTPSERMNKWRESVPIVSSDHESLDEIVSRSTEDLGSLRIFDPDYPDRQVIAAGAPWFMTVFGRDSILTSYMSLIADPDLALGVLKTLARFQGSEVNLKQDEEPGRILHEMRFGEAASLSLGGGNVYYGSIDATPLFVVLLGELRRWGLANEIVDELLPACDRALDWIEQYGDKDGDGFVEYQRATDRGLINQGWKDSFDGVRFFDGSIGESPIALAEVQGYVYGAYLARAHFATEAGDDKIAKKYIDKASELKASFNERFWMKDKNYFAIGLDKNKKLIDSYTSNIGHCLWSGIIEDSKAKLVVDKLMDSDMFSGWGIRTLSKNNGGYNPVSYHCGSVWPHDNAIIAHGLMRYNFVEESHRVIEAVLDAARSETGRLPELYSGISRETFSALVKYPTSCSPQAWASATPISFLRTMLRLDPWVPHNKVWIAPSLPPSIKWLKVDRVPLAGGKVSIEIEGNDCNIIGLPDSIEIVRTPRHPHTQLG